MIVYYVFLIVALFILTFPKKQRLLMYLYYRQLIRTFKNRNLSVKQEHIKQDNMNEDDTDEEDLPPN